MDPTKQYIYPGTLPLDTDGKPIQAHGAGMFYENGTYYWYGENKEFTTGKNKVWTWGIRFYSSNDLVNWKDEGLVIPPNTEDKASTLHLHQHVDRPHILYCHATKKYVCWLKISAKRGWFTILTADRLLGPYTMVRDHFEPFGLAAGDFDLWKDEEGEKAYLFFEHDHLGLAVCELKKISPM